MSGAWSEFDWHGRTAQAWQPDPLGIRKFEFAEATVRAAEQATSALSLSDQALPASWEPLARLLLRTEGIASSSIEGVRAPLLDVALAEITESASDAGWIADNLAAVTDALDSSKPLTVDSLHGWHERLMRHSVLEPEMIGAFRTAPSWIGGTSPLDAAFVPPQAHEVPALMDDLITYANEDHFDPVTHAALVHAQFETIHPYGDGNGRLGRILIGWLLRRRSVAGKLPPPISVLIARDPGGYISGLFMFREGPADSWVRWFAQVTSAAATQSAAMIQGVTELLQSWDQQLADLRADAAARQIVPLLPQAPVLTAAILADLLDVSSRAGRDALAVLSGRGIVEPVSVPRPVIGRPPQYFAATRLLHAMAEWARS